VGATTGPVFRAEIRVVAPNFATGPDVRRSNEQLEFLTVAKNKNHFLKRDL